MVFRRSMHLAAILLVVIYPQKFHAQGNSVFSNYEYTVTDDGTFGLYKPKAWNVGTQKYPNGRMVYVSDQKDLSYVSIILLEKIDPKNNSVTFACGTLTNLSKQMPDLKILQANSSRDQLHTLVKYQRGGPKNIPIEGRYCFNVKHPTAVVFGYEAPKKQFKEMIPTLLTIIANITVLDNKTYRRLASQRKDKGPKTLQMKQVSASDSTCSILVPQGWNLTAGKGAALCASRDGDIGYIFSFIDFVGQSKIPYFDNSSVPGIRFNYMPPANALIAASRHLGSINHRVIEHHPNPSWASRATTFLKRKADAEIVLISFTSKSGTPCVGYFDVVSLHPNNAGQWGIIPMGFWAPQSQFTQYLPSLIKIAESYRLNQKWASEYVRQGMANLQALMKKTSSMMSRYAEEMRQASLAGHQNRMKSSDFTSYKFSTYMRGEQEWVTGLEGGKIYSSDHWGLSSGGKTIVEGPPFNYYNYDGYYELGHIPVDISREVYEAVKGHR